MVLFNAVPAGAIETLYDEQKQPWFKQVDVGDFVGIVNMRDATCNLSLQDKKSRDEITVGGTDGSYKPPKHAKPHDGFYICKWCNHRACKLSKIQGPAGNCVAYS